MSQNVRQTESGPRPTRRDFLCTAGLAAAAATVGSTARRAVAQPGTGALGANDRIGVGMIGVGGRGIDHLKTLTQMKADGAKIEIVAVCDVYRPRMERAAREFNARGYMDHRELLADPRVDVVGIATPDHIHGPQVIDAVRAGKDVYCEKPFTHWRQFDLTREVVAEVKKSGRAFQIGAQGLSDGVWPILRKLVADGLIGRPIHAECGYFRVGDWGERGMPIDDPNARPGADLNWEAFLGDSPKRPFDVSRFFRWRMYEDYSGGPATDLFPHSLTPIVSVLGLKMPSVVVATAGKFRYEEREVPDTCNILIDYPEKITVAVLGTQGNDYSGTGERGSPGRVPIIRGWDGSLTVQKDEVLFIPVAGTKAEPKRFPIDHPQDTARHWADLFDCCRTHRQPAGNIDVAFYAQAALQMAVLGWRNGKAARYNAAKEKIVV